MWPCIMRCRVLPKIASSFAFTRVTMALMRGGSHS